MNNKCIGVCLIGAGRAGMIHARNFVSKVPNARMVAVADPVKEAAVAAAQELGISKYYLDYKEALQDSEVDAVIVVAPTKYHRDIVIDAANAGKHILCEKPMAMTVPECEEMIVAAKANKVKLQIGFMRRFDESFVQAKETIDQGEIGDVILVKSLTRGPSIPQPWMYDLSKSNGPISEVNSHDIDTLRWFTGSEFQSLYAVAGNYRCPDAKEKFPDFYDSVVFNAKFENGMMGSVDGAQGVGYGYDARVEILGTKGLILLGQLHEKTTVVCTKDNGMVRPIMNSWKYLFREAYTDEDISFVNCILNDCEPKVTGVDGMMAVKVVNAGNLSITEKRIVEL
jgi:predicted dehydrogenase